MAAICRHFGTCGSCTLQNIPYEQQVKEKLEKVRKLLFWEKDIEFEVFPSPTPWNYRNKMKFFLMNGEFCMYSREKYLFKVEECPIFSENLNLYKDAVKRVAGDNINDVTEVTIREAKKHNSIYCILLSETLFDPNPVDLFTGVCVITPSGERIQKGDKYWKEKIHHRIFLVPPLSFFQVNTYTAELLYTIVASHCEGSVLDLYCGVGFFSAAAVDAGCKRIVGVDNDADAIEAAKKNVEEGEFHVGDCRNVRIKEPFTTVVVDPPREGIGRKLAVELVLHPARTLIYVSCNPDAFVRDYNTLRIKYKISKIYVVDQFPHTNHVEIVAVLEKKEEI